MFKFDPLYDTFMHNVDKLTETLFYQIHPTVSNKCCYICWPFDRHNEYNGICGFKYFSGKVVGYRHVLARLRKSHLHIVF